MIIQIKCIETRDEIVNRLLKKYAPFDENWTEDQERQSIVGSMERYMDSAGYMYLKYSGDPRKETFTVQPIEPNQEFCTKREDQVHCRCWYDGGLCCMCRMGGDR